MDATILIATYNRAGLLARTLDSIAALRVPAHLTWEVLVVDNNSSDGTRAVVESRGGSYPAPLRYLLEPRQGKSHALNTGIAASSAAVLAFTDDDVCVDVEWLACGIRPLFERTDIDYTGGPVLPMWEAEPPPWLRSAGAALRGPIATLDYGPEPFILEERQRIAMGVNMAVRRSLFEKVGGFNVDLDRRGASLLGQGQAEFFFRTRAAGVRGLYVPGMRVHHHVPASRMRRAYFRRWSYWKGVARARIEDLHPVSELGVDLRSVPHVMGIPRFMWRTALESAVGWMEAVARCDAGRRMERELTLAYFGGYFTERRRLRRGTGNGDLFRAQAARG